MVFPTIVPFYAGVFAILYFVLSVRIIVHRRELKVAIGDGGQATLARRQRAHGNFIEYVPFLLLLLTYVEMQPRPAILIHGLCLLLLVARLSHAYGISQTKENFRFRMLGTAGTFAVLLIAALSCIYAGLGAAF